LFQFGIGLLLGYTRQQLGYERQITNSNFHFFTWKKIPLIGFNSRDKFKSRHDATQSIVTFYPNIFFKFLDCCAFEKEVKVDIDFTSMVV
jgi:hypothetical protein